MESTEVLVILGSPNSPEGELSDIAKSRLDHGAQLYAAGKLILCTGGWGNHFNTSAHAHAVYAKEYLLAKGIPESAFLEFALFGNTVEDASKPKAILAKLDNPIITVITTDFHLERVQLIFNEVLKDFSFQCVGVNSSFLDSEQHARLMLHERGAIDQIIQNGLFFSGQKKLNSRFTVIRKSFKCNGLCS
jgi:vancomycin permeability regulator SanA